MLELARSYPIDDSVPSPLQAEYQPDLLTSPVKWSLPLPDLGEPVLLLFQFCISPLWVLDSDTTARISPKRPTRTRTASRVLATTTAKQAITNRPKLSTKPGAGRAAAALSVRRPQPPARPASAPAPQQPIRTRSTSVRAPSESRLRFGTTGAGVAAGGVRSRSVTVTSTRLGAAAPAGQAARKDVGLGVRRTVVSGARRTTGNKQSGNSGNDEAGLFRVIADEQALGGDFLFSV